ncbi:sporulation-control protein [Streptomyces sp. WMMB 714]|uniref:sporulation protein n=1 Tax=Streptomyces sp. WMMB 714 TaxID=1286822 RepID=UPI0005F7832D|nr:sporulation protein [Streptomyces sp. WMMB 714]SCK09439.1 sporulation-control protein [Streptomyces sp. WMMB 714]
MVFKKLLGAIGVGGPAVDTVLSDGPALPGGALTGQVHLEGGSSKADIEQIALELVARVEAESQDGEHEGTVVFERVTVGGGFRLAEGERQSIPFSLTLPWETPITELHGQPLGVVLGVRTELQVAGARDKGDLDPLRVRPLPVQEAVLEALGQLGYDFRSADLELGHIHGTGQQLPFYQEIELTPPSEYTYAVNEVEVTFLASPSGVEVVLEADKRGGPFSGGHDVVNRHHVSEAHIAADDWISVVEGWGRPLMEHHGAHGSYAHGSRHHGGSHYGDGHGHSGHHGSSGPGMGTAIAAGAAGLAVGVAGGFVAAEVVDEIGDAFEEEDEEDAED